MPILLQRYGAPLAALLVVCVGMLATRRRAGWRPLVGVVAVTVGWVLLDPSWRGALWPRGMVDRLVADAELLDAARAWAEELGRGSQTALALGKSILDQTFELTAEQVFALGSQAQGICYSSAEHQAATAAFLDKAGKRS